MCPCSARARTSTETAIRKPDHHLGEDFLRLSGKRDSNQKT